jgi:adenylate cyclase
VGAARAPQFPICSPGVDRADRANTAVPRQNLVAKIAGIGAQPPFVYAKIRAEGKAPRGDFQCTPAAERPAVFSLRKNGAIGAASWHGPGCAWECHNIYSIKCLKRFRKGGNWLTIKNSQGSVEVEGRGLLGATVLSAFLETEINGEKRTFAIPGDAALCIGRAGSAGVLLDGDGVSRRHALLQRGDSDQFYITDLGSRNGTQVNQKQISAPVVLRPGDRIAIGNFMLTFRHPASNPVAAPLTISSATNVSFAAKLITVMVADIRDFTPLAQRIAPGSLSLITGTLFREAGQALQEHGAWAQKYIGDAVMAVWLHESEKPGAAADLRPVFNALSKLLAISARLQGTLGLDAPIQLGVGINTGWASVGNVGSIASADYTAVGDVVNKAFRLESATRQLACDIAVGQETYDLLAGSVEAGRIFQARSVKLKGYEELTTAYAASLALLPGLLESFRTA